MCANDVQRNTATDDVWDSSDSGNDEAGTGSPPRSHLDREWEARKQQFYNAGYRDGVEEGKEVKLQHGFNAGFSEGARAGYEFGLLKSALQVLVAHLDEHDSRCSKVQELLQQVSALNNKTVMQDTCRALLAQTPDAIISQHLQAALTLKGGADADTEGASSSSSSSSSRAAAASDTTEATTSQAASDPAVAAESSSPVTQLPLPLQLVSHLRQELQQLGFDLGSAPALTVAASSPPAAHGSEEADEQNA